MKPDEIEVPHKATIRVEYRVRMVEGDDVNDVTDRAMHEANVIATDIDERFGLVTSATVEKVE